MQWRRIGNLFKSQQIDTQFTARELEGVQNPFLKVILKGIGHSPQIQTFVQKLDRKQGMIQVIDPKSRVSVCLDDFIPVDVFSDELIRERKLEKPNLFVRILEKFLAKRLGSYINYALAE